ncbi:hypothetical protein S2091_2465 [Solimicrobium silvestre]|uniref:Uncharacterized protein n=1 Tax=Solimicrobium silvestre TaxID=2099400 RepID=A0A2S9GYD3_9BURK|nr:hypothetical protein S2091_2465 [Solimicrobium silvestre]
MQILEYIDAIIRDRLSCCPAVLKISDLEPIFGDEVPTIRARIRRGSFPVTVRQEDGGRQYVLLADVIRFLATGERQPQVIPGMRTTATSAPKAGRRGRPTKAEQVAGVRRAKS